jgi:hypothetical protein
MSRRRTSGARSARAWSRSEARIRQARDEPAAIAISFRRPVCGLEHDRASHAAPGCFGLTAAQLQVLRAGAVDELVNAVRHDAPPEHIRSVVAVLDVVDARLATDA